MSDPYDTQVGGNHYKDMTIQPSEFINKNRILFAEGNAIKYICRHNNKGGKQDLEKAKHYIDMIIERDYGDHTHKSQTFVSFGTNTWGTIKRDTKNDPFKGTSIEGKD